VFSPRTASSSALLYVNRERARKWSRRTVAEHWEQLFRLPPSVQRWQRGAASQAEAELAGRLIEGWRARLLDISWFMRCLNENLARRANAEDQCKGRFWEGRFRSQALLDEAGLLTAMAYVDLNPIRAGIASTSAGERAGHSIPFVFEDYLQLVDWTGRAVTRDKRGSIDHFHLFFIESQSIQTRGNV
jgi:hypothetical protein